MILSLLLLFCSVVQANKVVLTSDTLAATYRRFSKQSEPERLVMEARKKEEGHFLRSFFPSIEASYSREAFQEDGFPSASSYGWGAEGRLSLYNGGRDSLEETVREQKTHKAAADRKVKDQDVLHSLRKTFWTHVYAQALIQTIQKALADNDAILALSEKRIRAGVASTVDRLDFKMNGIRLRQDLQKAKNELRSSENQLRGLLMISAEDKIVVNQPISDEHDVLDAFDSKKENLKQNPAFASIQAQSEIETSLSKINSRWFLLKLDLYAGYERPSLRQGSTAGFG